MAIDVQDVIDEYGDYYLDHGQNQADLLKKIHRPSVTASYFTRRPTAETVLRNGTVAMERVLQPFQKQFTKAGGLIVSPNTIHLFHQKIDAEEYPDDIADTWLGFLEGPGIDREAWPFVRWFIEIYLIDQAEEDFELSEVYEGIFVPPTPGTAGAAGTSMDGIKKLQDDHSSQINTISMGALPGDDADLCTYIEEFAEQLPVEERKRMKSIFLNEALELRYRKGKDQKYNTNYAQETSGNTLKYFPNISVVGLPSMGTAERIWTTMPYNMVAPIKKTMFNNIKIEAAKRLVSFMSDWWTVCAFLRYESVHKNDL